MAIIDDSRYRSQIDVLDQEKLQSLEVILVGTGPISHYLLASFCGMGIGNIHLLDDENNTPNKNSFLFFEKNQEKKIEYLGKIVRGINNDINVEKRISPRAGGLKGFREPHILINTSNNVDSKIRSLEFAKDKNIPLISASSDEYSGTLSYFHPNNKIETRKDVDTFKMERYRGLNQGNVTSGVMAGLITDLLLVFLLPTKEQKNYKFCLPSFNEEEKEDISIQNPIYFNLKSNKFTSIEDTVESNIEIYSRKKILMVGAGALGTFAGLGIALTAGDRGNILDILDCKSVSPHNLNRQIFYSPHQGKPKVNALEKILKLINSRLSINPFYAKLEFGLSSNQRRKGIEYINTDWIKERDYDLIISCLDNLQTKKHLIDYAIQDQKPLITGGSAMLESKKGISLSYGGDAHVYIPSRLPCFECSYKKIDDHNEPIIEDPIPGCENKEQALIIPNLIAGTFQAALASTILSGTYPSLSVLSYQNFTSERISGYRTKKRCGCMGDT